jgi:hypothetical protein
MDADASHILSFVSQLHVVLADMTRTRFVQERKLERADRKHSRMVLPNLED